MNKIKTIIADILLCLKYAKEIRESIEKEQTQNTAISQEKEQLQNEIAKLIATSKMQSKAFKALHDAVQKHAPDKFMDIMTEATANY